MKRRIYIKNKRRFTLSLIIFFISLQCIATILFGIPSVSGEPVKRPHTYFESVKINSGDTLWSIALKYKTDNNSSIRNYISQIKHINHLDTDQINAGEYIIIPIERVD